MSTSTVPPGEVVEHRRSAAAIFEQAFFKGREPRSDAYRAGVLQALQHRIEATPFPRLAYAAGSPERDAFFAGVDEGRQLAEASRSREV